MQVDEAVWEIEVHIIVIKKSCRRQAAFFFKELTAYPLKSAIYPQTGDMNGNFYIIKTEAVGKVRDIKVRKEVQVCRFEWKLIRNVKKRK